MIHEKKFFGAIKVDTIDQFKDVEEILIGDPLMTFRGQPNYKFKLESTIERLLEGYYNKYKEYGSIIYDSEIRMISEFKRFAHTMIKNPPEDNKNIEWFSIFRHFGGPCSLIDFTRNFYYALYFGIPKIKVEYSSIYCIDLGPLTSESYSKNVRRIIWQKRDIKDILKEISYDDLDEMMLEKTKEKYVMYIEPIHLFERIKLQNGHFLFPTNRRFSFMENLYYNYYNEERKNYQKPYYFNTPDKIYEYNVVKLDIKYKLWFNIISKLNSIGISSFTLFPDLDGYAKSFIPEIILKNDY